MNDDDDLRELLRRADPAAALAPAAPDHVRQLTEEAMSRTHTRRWALPVAAAALVLVAGGAAWALNRPAAEVVPPAIGAASPAIGAASPAIGVASPAPAVWLTTSGVLAKCVEPTASRLSEISDFAFEGAVDSVEKDVVTLKVTTVFRGDKTESVQVEQSADHSEANARFEVGESYLVASAEGRVLICGYTGPADAFGLRDLYEEAF